MAPSNISSFFFYDLETSGINPRSARIMQFAGQRMDMDLNPIGQPYNILIKLSEDIIPEPGAILVTGITPQQTLADGITEAEFFKIFTEEIATPNTIFTGFNNIRFDDEFIRFGLYRNFYDAYEWQWKDGSSRWDILDVSRMTRALRPDGIKWPFAPDGKPTNRLEYLTSVNKLSHNNAHDALSDVSATIEVAKLIKQKQPKLFDYMLNLRGKRDIKDFVAKSKEFLYVSGKYSSDNEKLAVVQNLGNHPAKNDVILVYDLLIDPTDFIKMSPGELAEAWKYKKDQPQPQRVPIKTMQFNRCPAVGPLNALLPEDKKRLKIDDKHIARHRELLKSSPDFYTIVCNAIEILNGPKTQQEMVIDNLTVDEKLYDGFISDQDKKLTMDLHKVSPQKLSDYKQKFKDPRLKALVPLFKARNFSKDLNNEEREVWESHKASVYLKNLPTFVKQFEQVMSDTKLTKEQRYSLEELKMYVESLIPPELYI